MVERGFVDSLIETLEVFPGAVVLRPNDSYTIGIPDILAWVPGGGLQPWSIAIEAKVISPLMEDPFHRGRRTGQMLKHPFTGPQMSMLRKLKAAGVDAFGLVRVAQDICMRIQPEHLPVKSGNFTYEELMNCGVPIYRADKRWAFWHDQVPRAGHRDDPGIRDR
jgi:hypothetical protein